MTSPASNSLPNDASLASAPPSIFRRGTIGRARLLLAAALCFALFYWAATLFGFPSYPGYSASLLQQDSPVLALLMTLVLLAISAGIGGVIAGAVHAEAGLLTAAFGLIALSCRGGAMQYVLIASDDRGVYLLLAVESALLLAMLVGCWQLMRRWLVRQLGAADPAISLDTEDDGLNQRLLACAGQVVITILCLLLLARSDAKLQVVASAAISAWVGAVGSYLLFPTRPSVFYWIGPGIVAIFGYVLAYMGAGDEWRIGIAAGPLARPLPLDFLGAGVVGALTGMWTSRNWQHRRETEEAAKT